MAFFKMSLRKFWKLIRFALYVVNFWEMKYDLKTWSIFWLSCTELSNMWSHVKVRNFLLSDILSIIYKLIFISIFLGWYTREERSMKFAIHEIWWKLKNVEVKMQNLLYILIRSNCSRTDTIQSWATKRMITGKYDLVLIKVIPIRSFWLHLDNLNASSLL